MTLNDIIRAINVRSAAEAGNDSHDPASLGPYFIDDFAGAYDISKEEAERIADRSNSLEEFEAAWQNTDWWTDAKN